MEGASAAMQQKRKSNHFLITMLPRLVGLICRKRIMFFDRSPHESRSTFTEARSIRRNVLDYPRRYLHVNALLITSWGSSVNLAVMGKDPVFSQSSETRPSLTGEVNNRSPRAVWGK